MSASNVTSDIVTDPPATRSPRCVEVFAVRDPDTREVIAWVARCRRCPGYLITEGGQWARAQRAAQCHAAAPRGKGRAHALRTGAYLLSRSPFGSWAQDVEALIARRAGAHR